MLRCHHRTEDPANILAGYTLADADERRILVNLRL